MKYIYYTLGALLLSALVLGCTYENNHSVEISEMRDLTEQHIAQPRASELISLYGENMWDGRAFRYQTITDVSINPVFQLTLAAGGARLLSNKYVREDEIAAFNEKIMTLLDSISSDTIGRERSSVYVPFATELNRLVTSNADTRVLVIHSDMRENTESISFYHGNTLRELQNNPDSIRAKLESRVALNTLTGIRICIVYQPRDPEDDRTFSIVSSFYKTFLESKGATVSITATPTL